MQDNVTIYADNTISINGQNLALRVAQEKEGTRVFRQDSTASYVAGHGRAYKLNHSQPETLVELPHNHYSLSCNKPASGRPGKSQFVADLLASMGLIK